MFRKYITFWIETLKQKGTYFAVQFSTSTTTIYKPVEIITSYGSSGSSSQIIKTEVVRSTGPPIVSALYSKADTTINGTGASIDGTDNCGNGASLPPVYLFDGNGATLTEHGTPTYGGNPDEPQSGNIDIDIEEYVNMLKDAATEIIEASYFGVLDGFESYLTFWKENEDDPFLLIKDELIFSLEILKEKEDDHS